MMMLMIVADIDLSPVSIEDMAPPSALLPITFTDPTLHPFGGRKEGAIHSVDNVEDKSSPVTAMSVESFVKLWSGSRCSCVRSRPAALRPLVSRELPPRRVG